MKKAGLILLCLLFKQVYAQEPFYQHFTVRNGLPGMELFNMFQDSRKFLWIGSGKGIIRFDGKSFTSYTSPEQVSMGISGIGEDKYHRLWCHDFTGRIFIIDRDSMFKFKDWDMGKLFRFPRLYFDKEKNLWIVTTQEIFLYKPINGSYVKQGSSKLPSLQSAIPANPGLYLTAGNTALFINEKMEAETLAWDKKSTIPNKQFPHSFWFKLQNTNYLLTENRDIYQLEGNHLSFAGSVPNLPLINLCSVIDSNLWISTAKGAYQVTRINNTFQVVNHYYPHTQIAEVLKDHEGNYWMSSLNDGLYMIPSLQLSLSLPGQNIWRLNYGQGSIFAGTVNGEIYRCQNKAYKLIYESKERQFISAMHFDTTGKQLYFATHYLQRIPPGKTSLPDKLLLNHGIKEILTNNKGVIFAATASGLIVLVPQIADTSKLLPAWWYQYMNSYSQSEGFKVYAVISKRIIFMTGSADLSDLWVGTQDSVFHFSSRGKEALLFNGKSFTANKAISENGQVWLATMNDGILHYHNQKVTQYTTHDGLTSNRVLLIERKGNQVLALNEKALQCFDTKLNQWYTYNENDGINPNAVNDMKLVNDQVWLATTAGLLNFPVSWKATNQSPPVMYLSGVYNGKNLLSDIYSTSNISLKAGKYNLKVKLGAISFRNLGKYKLQYRITGWNNAWNTPLGENINEIELATLPEGDYLFEARALNEDNVVSKNLVRVPIHIDAPYWKRWWFILLCLLFLFATVRYFFLQRIKSIKQGNKLLLDKERLEKELKASTLASIKSQMNPHFIFNALNTIQSFIYKNERKEANFFLGKFSDLMRTILQLSSVDAINAATEIEALKLYLELETMRFNNLLETAVEVDKKLDLENCFIPPMLIQPYVENAIKHGLIHKKGERKLQVRFHLAQPELLQVVIEDNGVGRKKAEELKGKLRNAYAPYASTANQKRLELLNENKTDKIALQIIDKHDGMGNSTGTTVILFIPFTTL